MLCWYKLHQINYLVQMSFHTSTSTSIFKDEEHLGQRERMSIILMSIAKLPSSHTYE